MSGARTVMVTVLLPALSTTSGISHGRVPVQFCAMLPAVAWKQLASLKKTAKPLSGGIVRALAMSAAADTPRNAVAATMDRTEVKRVFMVSLLRGLCLGRPYAALHLPREGLGPTCRTFCCAIGDMTGGAPPTWVRTAGRRASRYR